MGQAGDHGMVKWR